MRRSHAPTVDGKPALAVMELNYSIIPLRPAGAGWSSIRDMLKYVQMELNEGTLPDGSRYIKKDTLLARRAPQVPIGKDTTYGMGLMVDTEYGTPVVHHGGDMVGYHSDMMWLPEHNVGAVVLTNADPGWILRTQFRRKLLEVLFDGRPEADADVAAQAKSFYDQLAAERKLLTVPALAADAAKLASHYVNDALGEITVSQTGAATVFDFGEWRSEVATRHNPDGSVSFITIAPGHHRLRVRRRVRAEAVAHRPGRAARVRVCRRRPDVGVEVAAPSSLSGTERIVTDSDRHGVTPIQIVTE